MIQAFEAIVGRENVLHYDYLQRLRDSNWGVEMVNDEFFQQAVAHNPDLIWLQLQNSSVIAHDVLDKIRERLPACLLVHWSGDVREKVGEYFAGVCKRTHLTLAANKGYLQAYRNAGAPDVGYLAHGLDWFEDVLGVPEWEPPFKVPDVVYCGNHYGDRVPGSWARIEAVRALHEAKIDVGVVGGGWEETGLPVAGKCHVKQQFHVYRRAKVVLSVNHFPDLAGYHGDRTIIGMASGTPVVTRHFPDLDKEFTDGVHLLVYRSPEELVKHVSFLLGNEFVRFGLGRKARAEAMRAHTWFSRILEVLPRLELMRQQK